MEVRPNLSSRPWAKDRTQVIAERGVLWPDLATRLAVGEHVILGSATNLLDRPYA